MADFSRKGAKVKAARKVNHSIFFPPYVYFAPLREIPI